MIGLLRRPGLQRWLPVITVPPVLLADGLLSTEAPPIELWDVAIAYAAVVPLIWRERLGFMALAPWIVAGVVAVLWAFEPGTTVVLIPAWALFDLARFEGRREAIIAAIAVVPCVVISIVPFADSGGELVSVALRNVAICELAIAFGYVAWHNRRAIEREIGDRAAAAEQRLGQERLRIAREVHDVVAHSIVAINVQAGVAAHLIDRDLDQARGSLTQIKRISGEALNDLRATLGILRDPELPAPVGPAAGIEDLDRIAEQLRLAGIEVEIEVETAQPVPAPVEAACYRIVQEALTNVLRHAAARHAQVTVSARDEVVRVVVSDDGRGPDDGPGSAGSGAGLRGMRERAEAFGGSLQAGPGADGGWRVEARLPAVATGVGPSG